MIVLRRLTEPEIVDLGDGMKITVRRLTSFDLALAEEAARKLLLARAENETALGAYAVPEWTPEDGDRQALIARIVTATELAMRGVTRIEGICLDDAGAPASIDRATLSTLLAEPHFYNPIMEGMQAASRILAREKKALGLSANGSSEPAEGPAIAPAAPALASAAPPSA